MSINWYTKTQALTWAMLERKFWCTLLCYFSCIDVLETLSTAIIKKTCINSPKENKIASTNGSTQNIYYCINSYMKVQKWKWLSVKHMQQACMQCSDIRMQRKWKTPIWSKGWKVTKILEHNNFTTVYQSRIFTLLH